MLLLGRHGFGQLVALGEYVTSLTHVGGELERAPQDIDVEVGKLGIVEVEVRRAVGVRVQQVGTCPVEHGHEVVADGVDTFCRKIAQRLLIHLNLVVAVGTAVLDGLYYGQALYHTPAHAVALDVLTEVTNFLACPYFAEGYVVQSGDDALNANLSQHGKRYLILLAKPTPGSFHIFNSFLQ